MSRTLALLFSIGVAAGALAQDHHHHMAGMAAAPAQQGARPLTIRDVTVQAQDGRKLHFYSDLVKGRRVAINFIFTSCTTVCPVMGLRFAQLQPLLGKRDVSLISISIDPANDTPARLRAWSARMGAKSGWTLVTGAKTDIDTLLQSLGAPAADPTSHSPLVIVVDDRAGKWQRVDGLSEPAKLLAILDGMSDSQTAAAGGQR